MVKGVTKNGFCFEVDESRADDMEFLEVLAETQKNVLAFPKACSMLLGEEQKGRLYDQLRNEDGRVPISEVEEAFMEIMSSSGEQVKNS